MRKIAALITPALLAVSAFGKHRQTDPTKWPEINTYTNFETYGRLEMLERLYPGYSASGLVAVDSDRNQVMLRATIGVPLFKFDAGVLFDFNKGSALVDLPGINLCQKWKFNYKMSLKDTITEFFNPSGKITKFRGEYKDNFTGRTLWEFNSRY